MKLFALLILLICLVINDSYVLAKPNSAPIHHEEHSKNLHSNNSSTTNGHFKKRNVLLVCLGNICRSPMAEAVFKQIAKQKGVAEKWHFESAGTTNMHIGRAPDDRAMAVLKENGIEITHEARQLCTEDYDRFDFILGMDQNNLSEINNNKPEGSKAQIMLFGSFDPKGHNTIIDDPYYDIDNRGFEICFEVCTRTCKGFLDKYK